MPTIFYSTITLEITSAAPGVTSTDDATMPGLIGSRPFEGQGGPTRRTPIFERSAFKTFQYDTYSTWRAVSHIPAGLAEPAGCDELPYAQARCQWHVDD
jgi:predicted Zn-dependent protease